VVDRYTKLARYVPTRKTITAEGLAESFLDTVLKDFGIPDSIVSDRGSVFTAKFWSALCYHCKIKRRLSSAFHPQTDGQTERQNQTLEQYLRSYINYQQDDWAAWLSLAEFAYNNSRHAATGITPFYAAYGFHPTFETRGEGGDVDVPAARERATRIQNIRIEMEKQLTQAIQTQATYYDKKRKPRTYAVGDMVWLAAKNIKTTRPSRKLDYKYHGPFRVEKAIGEQAYRLELPKTLRIHPVFHVSLLELHRADSNREQEPPQPLEVDGEEYWEVEKILSSRIHRKKLQYLVKWLGFSDAHNQWLPAAELAHIHSLTDAFHAQHPRMPTAGDTSKPPRQNRRRQNKK
jgi:hypothetical protein